MHWPEYFGYSKCGAMKEEMYTSLNQFKRNNGLINYIHKRKRAE